MPNPEPIKTEFRLQIGDESKIYPSPEAMLFAALSVDRRKTIRVFRQETFEREMVEEPAHPSFVVPAQDRKAPPTLDPGPYPEKEPELPANPFPESATERTDF
jgi:hypothetical protein